MNNNYKNKYFKYKSKYILLKKQFGGEDIYDSIKLLKIIHLPIVKSTFETITSQSNPSNFMLRKLITNSELNKLFRILKTATIIPEDLKEYVYAYIKNEKTYLISMPNYKINLYKKIKNIPIYKYLITNINIDTQRTYFIEKFKKQSKYYNYENEEYDTKCNVILNKYNNIRNINDNNKWIISGHGSNTNNFFVIPNNIYVITLGRNNESVFLENDASYVHGIANTKNLENYVELMLYYDDVAIYEPNNLIQNINIYINDEERVPKTVGIIPFELSFFHLILYDDKLNDYITEYNKKNNTDYTRDNFSKFIFHDYDNFDDPNNGREHNKTSLQ